MVLDLNYLELLISPENNRYFISQQASIIKIMLQPKESLFYNFPTNFDPTIINIDFTDFPTNFHLIDILNNQGINFSFNNNSLQFTLTKDDLIGNGCIVFEIVFYDRLMENQEEHSFHITYNGDIIPYNYFLNPNNLYGVYLINTNNEKLHTSNIPLRITDIDNNYGDNIGLNTHNISVFNKTLTNKIINPKNFKIEFRVLNQASYELIENKIRLLYLFLQTNDFNPNKNEALRLFFDYNRDEYYNIHYTGEITKKYDGNYATFTLNFTSVDGLINNEHDLFKPVKGYTRSNTYINPRIYLTSDTPFNGGLKIIENITGTYININPPSDVKSIVIDTKTWTAKGYTANGTIKNVDLDYSSVNIYLIGEYDLTSNNNNIVMFLKY